MRIVAGDIGGTKVLLRFVEDGTTAREQRFESAAYKTFDDLLRAFLGAAPHGKIDSACFAVAGPVFEDRAEVTNTGWFMSANGLAEAFSIGRVTLINDFYAVALGVPLLAAGDLISLNAGKRVASAPIAILGAGTGLGEAALVYDGKKYDVVPGEGGHADFGPQDEEQGRLFVELLNKYGHVSWERVLSGMGLVNIDDFLRGITREYDEHIPMEIASLADEGDAIANRTFEIFVDIYGAEAGNMALRLLARGGVFLAGGIAAKNMRHFTTGRFMEAFLRKGRFTDVVKSIPIDVIVNPEVGLLGAVEAARRGVESP
ncbi:MAG TPA: glucokinase [Thermoanaerobaculia bacterium]|jgi:glucokinase